MWDENYDVAAEIVDEIIRQWVPTSSIEEVFAGGVDHSETLFILILKRIQLVERISHYELEHSCSLLSS